MENEGKQTPSEPRVPVLHCKSVPFLAHPPPCGVADSSGQCRKVVWTEPEDRHEDSTIASAVPTSLGAHSARQRARNTAGNRGAAQNCSYGVCARGVFAVHVEGRLAPVSVDQHPPRRATQAVSDPLPEHRRKVGDSRRHPWASKGPLLELCLGSRGNDPAAHPRLLHPMQRCICKVVEVRF